MLKILTFRDLPFWYNCFEFSLLFQMNQNDITRLASKLPSVSCCFTDPVSAVLYSMSVCAVDCFHVLWNETIIFCASESYYTLLIIYCLCFYFVYDILYYYYWYFAISWKRTGILLCTYLWFVNFCFDPI